MRWRESTESATTNTPTVLNPRAAFSIAVTVTALALVATSCTSSAGPGDGKSPENTLSKLDPCTILKSEKAAQAGLPGQGEPDTTISSQPGCQYFGDEVGISIYRIAEDSFDEYAKRSVWSEFKPLSINGRNGAEARASGWTDKQCLTAVAAGGGVIAVQASPADSRKPFDACGESLKVAKLIEPDLPE